MTDDDPRAILLVEDNKADAVIVFEALEDARPRHDVVHVTDLTSALEEIGRRRPDCVLLDLGLPDASGVAGVDRILRSHSDLPIVVLTGADDPGLAKAAIHHGAQDYLEKHADHDPEMLSRTIGYAIERARVNASVLESNRALASFAAMVAHDLRSPLSIASGMLELLERKADDELSDDLQQLVTRSIGALKRASDLVSTLLMYSQAKRPDESTVPVDLHVAAQWAIAASGALEQGATVSVDEDLPTVMAGEAAMRQVFQNLFSNAVRYAAVGRPAAIRVDAEDGGDTWTIRVIDNGQGIDAEHRERVFDEGERLGQAGDGFGLGLPAVRAVIERYDGTVWIEDPASGPGTAVCFRIPAV